MAALCSSIEHDNSRPILGVPTNHGMGSTSVEEGVDAGFTGDLRVMGFRPAAVAAQATGTSLSSLLALAQALTKATVADEAMAAVTKLALEVGGFARAMIFQYVNQEAADVVSEALADLGVVSHLGVRFGQEDLPAPARAKLASLPYLYAPGASSPPAPPPHGEEPPGNRLLALGATACLSVPLPVGGLAWGFLCAQAVGGGARLLAADRDLIAAGVAMLGAKLQQLQEVADLRRTVGFHADVTAKLGAGTAQHALDRVWGPVCEHLRCDAVAWLPAEEDQQRPGGAVPAVWGAQACLQELRMLADTLSGDQSAQPVACLDAVKVPLSPNTLRSLLTRANKIDISGIAVLSCGRSRVVAVRGRRERSVTWAERGGGSLQHRHEAAFADAEPWALADIALLTSLQGQLSRMEEEAQQHEREVRRLQKARDDALMLAQHKGSFLANMSHELRTPFHGMMGNLTLLLDSELSRSQRDCAGTAFDCAAAMLEILDDVLLVSKLENQSVKLREVTFDLVQVAHKVYELMDLRAKQARVAMELELVGLDCVGADHESADHRHTDHDRVVVRSEENKNLPADVRPALAVGDPGRLRQVLTNLVCNAIKFTKERGQVKLKIIREGSAHTVLERLRELAAKYAVISVPLETLENQILAAPPPPPGVRYWHHLSMVEDTGIGIDQLHISQLFKQFTQLENTAAHRYDGTGLGLKICKELVELMGGAIATFSTSGVGSCFVVWLQMPEGSRQTWSPSPLDNFATSTIESLSLSSTPGSGKWGQPPSLSTPSQSPREPAPQNSFESHATPPQPPLAQTPFQRLVDLVRNMGRAHPHRKTILVAEDNRVNQMVLDKLIRRVYPYTNIMVADGRLAVAAAKERHDDLLCVILDLHMPEMDGFQACLAIREWEKSQQKLRLPILALTADVMEDSQEQCWEADMDGCVTKPVPLAMLRQLLLPPDADHPQVVPAAPHTSQG